MKLKQYIDVFTILQMKNQIDSFCPPVLFSVMYLKVSPQMNIRNSGTQFIQLETTFIDSLLEVHLPFGECLLMHPHILKKLCPPQFCRTNKGRQYVRFIHVQSNRITKYLWVHFYKFL